jgi:phosphoribosylformylglycinamidine synthase
MVDGVHDVSAGGLGVAVAEMVARSGVGAHLARVPDHRALFGEGPSRVVCCVDPERLTEVLAAAEAVGVPTTRIGLATGDRLIVKDLLDVAVDDVRHAHEDRLPEALGAGTTNR